MAPRAAGLRSAVVAGHIMAPLDLVRLTPLIDRTGGNPDVAIGLIDGPVALDHPQFAGQHIRELPGNGTGACAQTHSSACSHGTFVAGILSAKRGSIAPAICPDCTLLVRPIFAETNAVDGEMPSATPEELARAILGCVEAGARVLNVSAVLSGPSIKGGRAVEEALHRAASRGVIVVAAAGNRGTLGSTAVTGHPWVISVVAYDSLGRPMGQSNLGRSIGRRGLGAPGENITSLGATGEPLTAGGTSAAAPFVTGAIALLWSEFPGVTATVLKRTVTQAPSGRGASVVPPLLDAWGAYRGLRTAGARGKPS